MFFLPSNHLSDGIQKVKKKFTKNIYNNKVYISKDSISLSNNVIWSKKSLINPFATQKKMSFGTFL